MDIQGAGCLLVSTDVSARQRYGDDEMKVANFLPLVCVVAWLHALAMAQGGWTQATSSGASPAGRYGHAMAFDHQRGKIVLFGGANGVGTPLGDTWEWDGVSWVQVATTGPAARFGHAMAYDSLRGRTLMFGSYWPYYLPDTWEWDGATWTLVNNSGPASLQDYAMAYDSQRGKVVLCGGGSQCETYEWHAGNTSWVYVGTLWSHYLSIAMVYDSQRAKTLLYGSGLGSGTWEWDGVSWTPVSLGGYPNISPPGRADTALAYDSNRRQAVLFGGYTTGVYYGDTWEWNGYNWLPRVQSPISPPAQGWHAMTYDSQRQRTVMVGTGGHWEWTGSPGVASTFGSACGSPPLALSPVVASAPTTNSTAQATVANIPSSLAFLALGWSRTTAGPFQLPVPLAGYGMTGCYMLTSTEVVGEPTTATGSTTASYSLQIPNAGNLIGVHLYLQAWAVAPGANPANIIVSNGLDWLIGY